MSALFLHYILYLLDRGAIVLLSPLHNCCVGEITRFKMNLGRADRICGEDGRYMW